MAHWRVWLATVLLIGGVALVSVTAESGNIWWAIAGYASLLFVPALIVDAGRSG
jgi:hypothetical protein